MAHERSWKGAGGRPRRLKRSRYDDGQVDDHPATDDGRFCREVDPGVVREVWRFLTADERAVASMLADGKGPSDVAVILGLESRQAAARVIGRVTGAIGVLCVHAGAIEGIERVGPRGKAIVLWPDWDAMRAVMLERAPLEVVARRLGVTDGAVGLRLDRVRRRLAEEGELAMAEALDDMRKLGYATNNKKKGRDVLMEQWREKFREAALYLVRHGVVYRWGGQNPYGRLHDKEGDFVIGGGEGLADCSGLVIEVLKEVGRIPRSFPDQGVRGLARCFLEETGSPEPGDLAFYGPSFEKAEHIMFHFGQISLPRTEGRPLLEWTDSVVGMSGGHSYMSEEWGKLVGARMRFFSSPRYRRGYLGSRKVR